jgi:hypothetical protein
MLHSPWCDIVASVPRPCHAIDHHHGFYDVARPPAITDRREIVVSDAPHPRYRLSVRAEGGRQDSPVFLHEVGEEAIHRYQRVRVEHVATFYSVNLTEAWIRFMASPNTPLVLMVTGFETVEKFGGTVQLKQRFVVRMEPMA